MIKTPTLFLTVILAAAVAPVAAQPVGPGPMGLGPIGPGPGIPSGLPMRLNLPGFEADDRADDLYDEGREAIEEGKYDRALDRFNRLIEMKTTRTDAALYWKAYSLAKLGRRADALDTLASLQQQFKDSRWIKDAKALEVELRQASGQTIAPESQNDEELKLMALRGLMNSDPDRALPIIEQMLTSGSNSPKVKDRALFVLSQSGSSRARDIMGNIAKGASNPDLQLRAIHYLGIMGGSDNRQILADVYRTSSDLNVKKRIINSFMVSGDRTRLLGLAKGETNPDLRGAAVQQLGVMGAHAELADLYSTETSVDIKKRIIQAMFVGGSADKLIELAKTEKDPQLRRTAVRNLGLMGGSRTGDAIKSIYQSDTSPEIRKEAINALFLQSNGKVLVELARAEKDPQMKQEMVRKMSMMGKSKEVTDYLLELLK
ncbi:MAG TPA: HEAT repeat domain-containing protein [Vicinamibacterales bacterium]|jgi:tetratricopeptide (TPR) repeat protein|nr:HEAT repeat domain-containing protein [Vicinamibacterales bacterium]